MGTKGEINKSLFHISLILETPFFTSGNLALSPNSAIIPFSAFLNTQDPMEAAKNGGGEVFLVGEMKMRE